MWICLSASRFYTMKLCRWSHNCKIIYIFFVKHNSFWKPQHYFFNMICGKTVLTLDKNKPTKQLLSKVKKYWVGCRREAGYHWFIVIRFLVSIVIYNSTGHYLIKYTKKEQPKTKVRNIWSINLISQIHKNL
jgi:hypothetical protein